MRIKMFQMGGPAPEAMPAEQGAPAQEMPAQGGAEEQLMQLSQQLVEMLLQQLQDPNAVMAVLEGAMQLMQEAANQNAPVFKSGGVLKKCGGRMKARARK